MEVNTVTISTEKYDAFTTLVRELDNKKTFCVKMIPHYDSSYQMVPHCNNSYFFHSISILNSFRNSAETYTFYTTEEIVENLTNEIALVRDRTEKEIEQREKIENKYDSLILGLKNITFRNFKSKIKELLKNK
jgi:hypothetical protein